MKKNTITGKTRKAKTKPPLPNSSNILSETKPAKEAHAVFTIIDDILTASEIANNTYGHFLNKVQMRLNQFE